MMALFSNSDWVIIAAVGIFSSGKRTARCAPWGVGTPGR